MSTPLRVLFLEDQPSDVELMLAELRHAGFEPDWQRVDSEEDYLAQLDNAFDIILADYTLPQFEIRRALSLLNERRGDIPLIVVTGTVSEEVAVECIKQGAADYLLKDRLTRLGQAVARALEQKKLQAEKRQSDANLRASEERYRIVSELISDYAYAYRVEADGTFMREWLTGSFAQITGFSPEEIDAGGTFSLYHPEDAPIVRQHVQEVLKGQSNSGEYRIVTKSGDVRWLSIHRRPEWDAQQNRVVRFYGVSQDITERKLAEEAEREQRALAEALRDTAAALTSTLDPQLVMARILENAHKVVPHAAANIMLIQGAYAVVASSRGYGDHLQEFLTTYHFPLDIPLFTKIMITGTGYLVVDTTTDPDWTAVPETAWIRSAITAPISIQGQIIGIINLDSATPGAFTPAHLDRLHAFADQAAIAFENARLLETERRHSAQLKTLHRASVHLTSTLDLHPVLETILEYATQLIAADDTHIFLYDGSRLTFGAAFWDRELQSKPMFEPRPNGLTYTTARTGQRIVIPNTSEHPLYQDSPWSGAIISLPLRIGSRVNGIMNLAFYEPRAFDDNVISIVELFADQAAIAIENAQLYERVLRQAAELERSIMERTSQLRQSKERVETIFNHSSDAIILAHSDGIIQQNNGAFNELFGYQIDEAFGRPLTILLQPARIEQFTQVLNAVISGKQRQRIEVTMRRKDGTTFEADVALSRITRSNSSASDIVCSVRDITDRIQAEAQIVRLNRDLERWAIELENALQKEKELNELKSRFVSMVSHEFRTPLATILSSSDLIKNFYARMTDDRRNEHLNTIQTSVQHLTEMLDDILMMSKAENVGLDFHPVSINLEAFCKGIAHQIQLSATTHEVVISTEGDCSQAVADEKLLRRIVNNLLTNAIKYSPGGGRIELELRCDEQHATICVKDEGIGIPDEDQQRLFETFHRARNVGTISGTGLGLAIVKQAIEAHGGTIHFASQVGVGTAFTVQWPLKAPAML